MTHLVEHAIPDGAVIVGVDVVGGDETRSGVDRRLALLDDLHLLLLVGLGRGGRSSRGGRSGSGSSRSRSSSGGGGGRVVLLGTLTLALALGVGLIIGRALGTGAKHESLLVLLGLLGDRLVDPVLGDAVDALRGGLLDLGVAGHGDDMGDFGGQASQRITSVVGNELLDLGGGLLGSGIETMRLAYLGKITHNEHDDAIKHTSGGGRGGGGGRVIVGLDSLLGRHAWLWREAQLSSGTTSTQPIKSETSKLFSEGCIPRRRPVQHAQRDGV